MTRSKRRCAASVAAVVARGDASLIMTAHDYAAFANQFSRVVIVAGRKVDRERPGDDLDHLFLGFVAFVVVNFLAIDGRMRLVGRCGMLLMCGVLLACISGMSGVFGRNLIR